MAMNEAERFRLQQALARVIGDEPTETLMANLPPVPWTELATKADLARFSNELRTELRSEMSELRGEIAELRGEMGQFQGETRGEFGAVRTEIAELRTAMNVGLAEVRIELHDQLRLNTWRLITAMGVFTAIMAAITRLG